MGMTIDESGKERGVAEIDSCGFFGSVILDLYPRTNFLDALPVGQNALIEQVASLLTSSTRPALISLGVGGGGGSNPSCAAARPQRARTKQTPNEYPGTGLPLAAQPQDEKKMLAFLDALLPTKD